MQDKKGIDAAEKILQKFEIIKSENYKSVNISEEWDNADGTLKNLLDENPIEVTDPETGELIPVTLDNPADYIKGIKAQGLLGLVLPSGQEISSMVIHPEYYISHRKILKGKGGINYENSLIDDATEEILMQEYLLEKCGSFRSQKKKALLKYQIEYLLAGKESDLENLEAIVKKILHIREAVNFTYLISDGGKVKEADDLAWLVSSLFFSPEIKEAVKMTILYAWSYAESVKDVKILLDGNKLPLLKNHDTWNTPLSQLLMFSSCLDQYKSGSSGMTYNDYLRFLLSLQSEKEILYRFMDLCEMDIRATKGNKYFQMDGCVVAVKATANVSSGYGNGYKITRTYTYE